MSLLQQLGIHPVINAAGTFTTLGGCRIRPQAVAAMIEVAPHFVNFDQLQRAVGERIAERIGVEATVVVAGASAGLALCAAACIAGKDPAARRALPGPIHPKEILVPTSHRNPYDQALRIGGGEIIEAGDLIATDANMLNEKIGPETAAIAFFLQATMLDASPRLEEVLELGRHRGVPVIVDAAAELPPRHNLWSIVHAGASLVVFSGGKEIGGPPASGLVVGQRDWIEQVRYHAIPNYGVGRPMKPSKEAIVGLLAALEEYLDEDEGVLVDTWQAKADQLEQALHTCNVPGVARYTPTQPRVQPACTPRFAIVLDNVQDAQLAQEMLLAGSTPVAVDRWRERLILNVQTLKAGEIAFVAERLSEVLADLRHKEAR